MTRKRKKDKQSSLDVLNTSKNTNTSCLTLNDMDFLTHIYKSEREISPIPFTDTTAKKSRCKATIQDVCPICGGCLWIIDNKLKCGWCGERFDL